MATPSRGTAQAIGGYANGCIAGAVALDAEGPGFQVLRRWRNRYWGHPQLIDYLDRLGAAFVARKLKPMLIGDMGQPRGGPMAYGHASHQIGIDVDILFTPGPMAASAREALSDPPSMLTANKQDVDPKRFGATQIAMLKTAAADPLVARIFVNYRIKKYLCLTLPPAEHGWIGRLRPWLGHDEHFHVRLKCPPGSPLCKDQEPIPVGDGCDDSLEEWFRPPPPRDPNAPPPPPPKPKILPPACAAVLTAP
ncbi:penicillin-insensitive murein endopeptidase [Oleomonas cavernae]|uniref:penicillin-insensitive murein endopeptidase n=1 Tax=Oleomonas cavernae TaxID=2320859 RepID=UPI0013146BCC|nr:penicillin-insensitive murein endopeptidase [Oleomonas cavernae]